MNVPPVYVPPTCSVVDPVGAPVKVIVNVADTPGARLPMFCGNGVPLMPPRFAVVSVTALAVAVPLLLMVMAATVFPLLHESTVEVLMRGEPAHAVLDPSVKL